MTKHRAFVTIVTNRNVFSFNLYRKSEMVDWYLAKRPMGMPITEHQ
jgi:hypothetical protein